VKRLSALGSAAGSDAFARTFLSELVGGVVGWVVWSAVTYLVGKSLFRSSGTFEQMLRVIGYASAPRALGLLNAIPCIGWLGALAGVIIALIAGVMAIAEGLNLDVGQAILVTVIGWIAQLVVFIIIAIIFGSAAAFFSILTGLFTR